MIQALKETPDRHLSFFRGIIPSLNTFDDDEILEFQMSVLQTITCIKQREKMLLYNQSLLQTRHLRTNTSQRATTSTGSQNMDIQHYSLLRQRRAPRPVYIIQCDLGANQQRNVAVATASQYYENVGHHLSPAPAVFHSPSKMSQSSVDSFDFST
ncbi:hypothetical protein RI129_002652 [Pyrocoelia pectoralis]|uniref:Uncharacterized protein n=1 Tax=Pyrocoelia pectoralis TaxID=417401 RepID=A0AAN7VGG1_9COLE